MNPFFRGDKIPVLEPLFSLEEMPVLEPLFSLGGLIAEQVITSNNFFGAPTSQENLPPLGREKHYLPLCCADRTSNYAPRKYVAAP